MKSPVQFHVITAVVAAFVLLAFLSCGHKGNRSDTNVGAPLAAPGQGRASTAPTIPLADVLKQIDAYPTPQGVNSETWTMLVTELKKQLVARSVDGKTLSVAVTGTENKVSDWKATYNASANTETYEWTQQLQGDYNGDGMVGITDLIPVAQLYGDTTNDKKVSSSARSWTTGELLGSRDDELGWLRWDYDAWDKIADGNGDKEVGIGDLQPIAQHYGEALSGYDVYFNGTKQYASGQSGSAPSILMPATLGTNISVTNPDLPRIYSITFGGTSGMMAMKRPSTTLPANGLVPISDSGAMCSSETWVNLLIDVTAVVAAGTRQVTYTPTVTPPGTYTYSWDFGDGSAVSTQQNPDHTFAQDGDYYVSVAVTGADAQAVKELPKLTLAVSAPWGPTSLGGTVSPTPPYDVTLTWNASTIPGVTYNIYYAATADSAFPARYNPAAPISSPTATITDADVPGAAQMFYRVTAVQTLPAGKLESDYSNEWHNVQGTDTIPPVWVGVPGILSAVPGDGTVTLTWGTAVDAQSPPVHYAVYWIADTGLTPAEFFNQATKISDAASPYVLGTHGGETLVNGTTYRFGVRASDSAAIPNEDGNLVTLKATPSKLANSPWPKFHHDQFNTGRSPYVGAQTNALKWWFGQGNSVGGPAIAADGTIYIGGFSNNLYALNPTDGSVKWASAMGGWVFGSPAIGADGTIYVGCWDNKVYALNPADGSVKWTHTTGGIVQGSPAIGADGTIYVSSNDWNVNALNPADGSVKWTCATGGELACCPAIGADGTIYVGTDGKTVHAINPSDGSIKWTRTTSDMVWSSAAVGIDGTVYAGSEDGNIYALNPTDGSIKWTHAIDTAGAKLDSSPAIGTDGTVYVGGTKVYALNPGDGNPKWTYTTGVGTGGEVTSSPAIGGDGTVYIGSLNGKFYALNAADGSVKWAFGTSGPVISSPAIAPDGTVYVGSGDGRFYAFGPGAATYTVSGTVTLSGNGFSGVTMTLTPPGEGLATTQADGKFTIGGLVNGGPYTVTPSKNGYLFTPPCRNVTVSNANSTGLDFTATPGVRTLANSAWPRFHGNAKSTGLSANVGAQTNTAKWTFSTGSNFCASPAIGADGTVYVGDSFWSVYAVNPVDGSVKWAQGAGGPVHKPPAIASDGTIYVGGGNGAVYALNPADGSIEWMRSIGPNVDSSPGIGVDGTVYIGSYDGKVYALNPGDGSVKWTYTTGGQVESSPAIGADGTVYIGSNHSNVYALNPTDGSVKWTYTTGGGVGGSPAIGADGTVYIGSHDQNVYALNPADGSVKWSYGTGASVASSPAIAADGTVYIGSDDYNVYALNPTNGSVKWTHTTGGMVGSSPAIGADGTVYVGSCDFNMYALNPGDGSVKWSYLTSGRIDVSNSPAIGADGTVYVGSYDGNLYAFGP